MTKQYAQENAYIMNAIDPEAYEVHRETDKEKLVFLFDTFQSEYGWRVKQVGLQTALMDWLQGLPRAINIAFYNHDILKLAKEWGSLPDNASEKQEDKILNNYWRFMSMRIISLWHKHGIA